MDEIQQHQLDQIAELQRLLARVARMEDLVGRLQAYFDDRQETWPPGLAAHFKDFLERKRDQIEYEWFRIQHLGRNYANTQLGESLDDFYE